MADNKQGLAQVLRQYNLTAGQHAAMAELGRFISNRDDCFILKGYAGTGKTFLIKVLAEYLTNLGRSFCVLAPTGRAAKVVKSRIQLTAEVTTIHKRLYSQGDLAEYPGREAGDSEDYKLFFKLRHNEDNADMVYIVDESSMVSDAYAENEYLCFGSGFLLKDLFTYVDGGANNRRKIIFVGDGAQLPPVNSPFSPALSADYLRSQYGCRVQEWELTEVVRQQEDSGILKNATRLRQALAEKRMYEFQLDTALADVREVDYSSIMQVYLDCCNRRISDEVIIVAYSNAAVQQYNEMIRNHFFPGCSCIQPGDRVLVVKNNLAHEIMLYNGDFGEVIQVAGGIEQRSLSLKRGKEHVNVTLSFRSAVIRFRDVDGREYDIPTKISEDLLYSDERDLSPQQKQALYVDFKNRHKHLKQGTPDFHKAFLADEYCNALHIKFGYAVTCHKAQGGEWKSVFADFSASIQVLSETYFRWAYTAMTRGKETLYAIAVPRRSVGSRLELDADNWRSGAIQEKRLAAVTAMKLPDQWGTDDPFLEQVYYAVYGCLHQAGIQVLHVRHHQYQERYELTDGQEESVLSIFYNGKSQITRMQPQGNSELGAKAVYACQQLCNTKITPVSVQQEQPPPIAFSEEKPYLANFYQSVKELVADGGIAVTKVEHFDFMEKYTFTQHGDFCHIDFYYNGKGQFTAGRVARYSSAEMCEQVMNRIQAWVMPLREMEAR